jgi:hypothetical protein
MMIYKQRSRKHRTSCESVAMPGQKQPMSIHLLAIRQQFTPSQSELIPVVSGAT